MSTRPDGASDSMEWPNRWAETLDLTAVQPPPSTIWERARKILQESRDRKAAAGRTVPVIGQAGHDLSAETRSLLRTRLRAALILLTLGLTAFFIRNLFLEARLVMLVPHGAMIMLHVGLLVLLSTSQALSTRQLRLIEAVAFGATLIEFAVFNAMIASSLIQEGSGLLEAVQGSPSPVPEALLTALTRTSAQLAAQVKGMVIFGLLIMVIYGLIIPNRAMRTAIFVVITLATLQVSQVLALWGARESLDFVGHVANFEQVSTNVLTLGLGAVLAVFGSRLIHSLRLEAYEAKRLGQYVLGRKIGSGGMGEVYQAEHQLLKRPCAVKLIRADRAGDPLALARFEREVRSTARLSHWNTIDIYDYGRTDDGTFYYVMEYLSGLSLDELVERHGPLPPGRVVYLLRQACEALAEAHGQSLIHRDLKPANLFAAHRGGLRDVVKVLDFGLVKPFGVRAKGADALDLTRPGTVTGSPLYMAPEQAMGLTELDARCDLHAIGAIGYFLLTGSPPFDGETPMQVMSSVCRDKPSAPSSLVPGIPSDLEAVFLRCLEKDPARRYASARELAEALAACRCAGEWDESAAAAWWSRHEPDVVDVSAALSSD